MEGGCFHFVQILYIERKCRLGMVAHTCNPSYLGGKDWENQSFRLAWAKMGEPI
jgi:hypothetical protein